MDPVTASTHGHHLPPLFQDFHHHHLHPQLKSDDDLRSRGKKRDYDDDDDDNANDSNNNNNNNNNSGGGDGDGNNNNNNNNSNDVNRRPRGRPAGSKNKAKPPIVITRDSANALRTHVMEVAGGCDVAESVAAFARRSAASAFSAASAPSPTSRCGSPGLRRRRSRSSVVAERRRAEPARPLRNSLPLRFLPPPAGPAGGHRAHRLPLRRPGSGRRGERRRVAHRVWTRDHNGRVLRQRRLRAPAARGGRPAAIRRDARRPNTAAAAAAFGGGGGGGGERIPRAPAEPPRRKCAGAVGALRLGRRPTAFLIILITLNQD
uniref:Uncharacterized protein n=1 Tax=Ananas comosus var. bracteatus TaxID=296719 RepID=A0A6V7QN14_ANACO|nr:unnamed protein product [Ananas comosus var. bracteatus]